MTDRLREARDQFGTNLPEIRRLAEERGDTDFRYFADVAVLLEAARAVLDGQTIWWCEEHDTPPFRPMICWTFEFIPSQRFKACRMVRRRLITWEAE